MTDHITIPIALLEQALEALTCNLHPTWIGLPQTVEAIRAELAKPEEASHTAMQLAAMVLSDCGISTNHTALHERVAERITRHEDDLIDRLKNHAKPPTPAWRDAPEVAALKSEIERLKELADSEGTRTVEYLRRARKAEAEIEQLRKDAERYRYLRRQQIDGEPGIPVVAMPNGMRSGYYLNEDTADYAIDAAIAKAEGRKE